MTDPISAMLNSLKMAGHAKKAEAIFPYSKLKHSILNCLLKEGYVSSVSKNTDGKFPKLVVGIAYTKDDSAKISIFKRFSKPSRRLYIGVKKIKSIHGVTVLSTPKGIMTSREAKKEMVGGEIMFLVQ